MITEESGEHLGAEAMLEEDHDSDDEDESDERENLLETPLDVQKAVLKMQLEKAITEENYEEAARLRDILGKLQA